MHELIDIDELIAVLWAAEDGLSIKSSYQDPHQKRIQRSLDITRAYMNKIGAIIKEAKEKEP